jgi:hypothetical protein
MDDNNSTNTSPTASTTNEDKNNDGYGIKARKRDRQSSKRQSARLAEKMLESPPQKKPPIEVNGGMEV